MFAGSGLIIGIFIQGALLYISLAKKQRLAVWILLLGLACFLALYCTVRFEASWPYRAFNLSIYSVLFAAVLITFAGAIGLFVRVLRAFATRQ